MSIQRHPKYLVPIRYIGGKSKVLSTLHEQLPPHFDEWKDCFMGGGSLTLSVMWQNKNASYFINEGNPYVFNFWYWLHKNAPKMQEWIWQKKSEFGDGGHEQLFLWCREKIQHADPFEQGCMWFILNRTSFNGMGETISRHHCLKDEKITDLKYCGALLRSVNLTITNYDYSVLLSSSSKKTFVYMDPPYELGPKIYYGKLHRNFNHDVFAMVVKDVRHNWLITYNDSEQIRQRFDGFKTTSMPMPYNKYGERVNELVIRNY